MEKKKKELNMIGVVNTEGYEADNRVYHRWGGCPTLKAGNAHARTIRGIKVNGEIKKDVDNR